MAGPHPLFVQIAGFHAFELQQAKGTPLVSGDYPAVRERFYRSIEEHFGYYWHNLSPVEQRVLATLPTAQESQVDVLRHLDLASLVVHSGQGYDYLSSAWRTFVQAQPIPGLLQAGPLSIDASRHQALLHGRALVLAPSQYSLLAYLAERPGQVVTEAALEQALWGDEYIDDPDRLKSVIKGLRQALGEAAGWLENVRGVGYRWRDELT